MAKTIPNLENERGGRIINPSLIDSFNKTSLDTTNSSPLGGPINSPQYNFETKYSSTDPYFIPGTQDQESQLSKSLTITALDVESDEAGVRQGGSGGPNRTNAINRMGTIRSDGTYQLTRYPTTNNAITELPSQGTILKNKEGQEVKPQILNAYTPRNTYMETMVKLGGDV